jgi:hypothetical protein
LPAEAEEEGTEAAGVMEAADFTEEEVTPRPVFMGVEAMRPQVLTGVEVFMEVVLFTEAVHFMEVVLFTEAVLFTARGPACTRAR